MPTKTETAFLTGLSAITGTGNFHSQATGEFFLPEIDVKGVGELAFPLPPAQARELVSAAEAAPYGMLPRGSRHRLFSGLTNP